MKKANFDRYLAEQLRNPTFAAQFEQAGEVWDVANRTTYLASLPMSDPPVTKREPDAQLSNRAKRVNSGLMVH